MRLAAGLVALLLASLALSQPAPRRTLTPDEQEHRALVRRHRALCSDPTLSDEEFRARWDDCDASRRSLDALYDELERQKQPGQADKTRKDKARDNARKAVDEITRPHPGRTPRPPWPKSTPAPQQ